MGGACSTEEGSDAYKVLRGNLGSRPFGRPTRSLEIILKIIFKNRIWGVDSISMSKYRVKLGCCIKLPGFRKNPENFLTR